MEKSNVKNNVTMLYIMNIVKLIFPLLTLPYLTRILTVETYGVISYVKSIMIYMQMFVDFGFLLSATKDIVISKDNKNELNNIVGTTIQAKLFIFITGFFVLGAMVIFIDILREFILFTFLSYITVGLTIFLVEFLFRGIEKMHIITIRFLIMKSISTLLTFITVRSDKDILLIPVLDILSSVVAVFITFIEIRKLGLKVNFSPVKDVIDSIKKSSVYFFSNIATTVYTTLNTILIGVFLSKSDIAYWSIVMQITGAAQAMYIPINDGIYPEMIKSKSIKLIKNVLIKFMPFVLAGSVITLILGDKMLYIIGGIQYTGAFTLLKFSVPLLILSFPAVLFGWPVLGAIDKSKETSNSTAIVAVIQIIGVLLLLLIGKFTLITIMCVRILVEFLLLSIRLSYFIKFRSEYNYE